MLLAASAVVFSFSSSAAKTILVPQQFETIQTGINSAHNGDTILVSTGTYFENINFRGKKIIVASRYLITRSFDDIRQTIIDGSRPIHSDTASVVLFNSGEDSTAMLCGFTLTGGVGSLVPGAFIGGGILIRTSSSPVIQFNIIRQNSAVYGGGIAVRNSFPRLLNNALVNNRAESGGGLWMENSLVTVKNNVFCANAVDTGGGAVLIKGSFIDFANNVVTKNSAPSGAGIYCSGGIISIEYCDFFGNIGGDFGGCSDAKLGDTTAGVNYNFDHADRYKNIFRDPQFTNPAGYDFSLRCTSRLIDAGRSIPAGYPLGGGKEDIGMIEFPYRTADLNFDGRVNLVDATILVNIIFLDTPVPCPVYVGDADCNSRINIADVIALVNFWAGLYETECLFTPQ